MSTEKEIGGGRRKIATHTHACTCSDTFPQYLTRSAWFFPAELVILKTDGGVLLDVIDVVHELLPRAVDLIGNAVPQVNAIYLSDGLLVTGYPCESWVPVCVA